MPDNYVPGPVPQDAVDFFKAKKLKPSFHYADTTNEEYAHNFTVGKVMQLDILEDFERAVEDVVANGTTLKQFQKDLTPLLQKKGWWGKREMVDPLTGELKIVQLGSPRRLKTIYEANLRSALAKGQWDRAQKTKKHLPYFVYTLGPSVEHRPEHRKWHGVILPIDDEFWQTHFVPNGWGCKCRIRQITQREADRLMAKGEHTTTAPEIEYSDWVNKRTGEVERVPVGIDRGWDTNPGYLRQVQLDSNLVKKADSMGQLQFATDTIFSPVRLDEYKMWVTRMIDEPRSGSDLRTLAVLDNDAIVHIAAASVAVQETLVIVHGNLISQVSGKGKRHKKKGDALSLAQWQRLPEMLHALRPGLDRLLWDKQTSQLLYLIKGDGDFYIKAVVHVDFRDKASSRSGLAEKLNALRTAFVITVDAAATIISEPRYEKIK